MSLGQKQKHAIAERPHLQQKARQLVAFTVSQQQKLAQSVSQELAQNPALYLDEEPTIEDEPPEEEEGWNPDFVKPEDEWEDGNRRAGAEPDEEDEGWNLAAILTRAAEERCAEDEASFQEAMSAIDGYRRHGRLPSGAPAWLAEVLTSAKRGQSDSPLLASIPTFDVAIMATASLHALSPALPTGSLLEAASRNTQAPPAS